MSATEFKYLQFAVLVNTLFRRLVDSVVDFHNGCLISASVTIVGRGKDRYHASVVLPLVTFHDQLMGSCNKVQPVNVRKLFRNVLPKGVPGSPR